MESAGTTETCESESTHLQYLGTRMILTYNTAVTNDDDFCCRPNLERRH